MERSRKHSIPVLCLALAGALMAAAIAPAETDETAGPAAADEIRAAVPDVRLSLLLDDVLNRNPRLARLTAEAAAAAQRAPQVKALPDPTASLTWLLMSPQTRVGPLQATVNISQSLPWFGTLALEEQAAMLDAAASRARVEAARLEVLTDVRTAYLELQFLDAESRLAREDRTTLEHYAELALARYASGVGLDQAVIKLQAEITRTDTRLLGIAARRADVAARLNGLRDRPQTTPVVVADAGARRTVELELEALRLRSLAGRPEMAAATAKAEAAEVRVERSKKAYSPNLMVGLRYGFVGRRDDEAGRLVPPEGNGDDDFAVTAGVSLPVWRSKLRAGVEEGTARRLAADEAVRETAASIDAELGELLHRIPLLEEQVDLYDKVLIVQARQSLQSAESAYAAGTAGALDLLDAERVLLQVRVAAARARTDLEIAYARLEGAVAGPLEVTS
ncbi:MAG: TolC family protein [Thermoanaerobaculales bacterium]|nr:TolC family protein [Thermoanaerobaculales bacterium]